MNISIPFDQILPLIAGAAATFHLGRKAQGVTNSIDALGVRLKMIESQQEKQNAVLVEHGNLLDDLG